MLTPKDAWQTTLGQLQLQLNRATFDTWLKGSELLAYEDGEFTVRVRHAYAKDWLEKHLKRQITQILAATFGRSVQINFIVYLANHAHETLSPQALLGGGQTSTAEQEQSQDLAPSVAQAVEAVVESALETSTGTSTDAKPDVKANTGANIESHTITSATPGTPAPSVDPGNALPEEAEGPSARDDDDDPQAGTETLSTSVPATRLNTSEWDPRYSDIRASRSSDSAAADQPALDRRYTFASFVTGPSNEFTRAAAEAVAHKPGTAYNPLVIYGDTGLGKTHLLHAIGHICRAAGHNVIYITAETFTNELVAAIRAKQTNAFREKYRNVDVLLLDDAQFLAGKPSTEEEFYHTFNALFSKKRQIVIACNQHPRAIDNLDDRLISRFEGGLLADIQPPQQDTRQAILIAKSQAQGAMLPHDVAVALATHQTSSVRELEGLLTQLLARATLTKQPITVTLAQTVLGKSIASPLPHRTINIDLILETTATYHQLSLDDLLSKRRTKAVVRARQIAMYLAREETEASLPQIGKALGGRNHSTVLYGAQKIADQCDIDVDLRREVNDIRRQLYLFPKD